MTSTGGVDSRQDVHIFSSEPDSIVDYLRKLRRFRGLIWAFAVRDLKVKYAQTTLGVAWSIIQPLTALLIFTFFFGYVLDWKAGDLPYSLHVLSGLLGWNFFSYIVHAGANSVQESAQLIRKVYFPKSILPFSKVLVAGAELGLSFLLLVPLMLYHGQSLSWSVILLPIVLLFNALCGLTVVFWVSAFAYKRRDLFHLLPFIVYFGIWVTPVFFTDNFLPESLRFITDLNPMASVVNMWRWMLFGSLPFSWVWPAMMTAMTALCLGGMYFFHRKEDEFSDYA